MQAAPVGRIGTPEDADKPRLFLVFDDVSFASGHVRAIDGAITAADPGRIEPFCLPFAK